MFFFAPKGVWEVKKKPNTPTVAPLLADVYVFSRTEASQVNGLRQQVAPPPLAFPLSPFFPLSLRGVVQFRYLPIITNAPVSVWENISP